ncbi:MAG: hypothetical protein ACRDA5_13680 [Clostridium sp.]
MSLIIVCIYIAIIPIVLGFCKAAGMDERFREGEECLESSYEKNN